MGPVETTRFTPDRDELVVLQEVIEQLAGINRLAGSPGEARAAELLRERLQAAGADAHVEPATFLADWAQSLALALVVPLVAGVLNPRRGRIAAGLASIAVGALVAEDIDNGPRLLRRALRKRRATTNVVARVGAADAPATLIVLAHHDAARTGLMFDQTAQQALYRRFPKLLEGVRSSPPQWLPAFMAPIAVGAGLLSGRRRLRIGGTIGSALAAAVLQNIARSKVVPGANDNLSGVAVLVALAERLRREPVPGLRVVLLSAGAEEELQGGVYGYLERHAAELDPANTWCLTVDTVGSPQLVMLEGEGPVKMHDYTDPSFRDLAVDVARERGVNLERGLRSRFSTDGIIISRAKIPTIVLVSLAAWRAPSNYHLMSDVPENLAYSTIAETVELAEGLARRLAR